MRLEDIKELEWQIIFEGQEAEDIVLVRQWQDCVCGLRLENRGNSAAVLSEVRAFQGAIPLPAKTPFYGEGYNMLSQYGGTIGKPECIGGYSDGKHYRLPAREGFFTVYNMVLFYNGPDACDLIGFTSCRRFRNEIRLAPGRMELALDLEGLMLPPGESLELESVYFGFRQNKETVLERFAEEISANHKRLPWSAALTGWCSWYAYGPSVTEGDILDTMREAAARQLPIRYIQIDDGYQTCMGDWLTDSGRFQGGMKEMCGKIRKEGFEPAVWAAPFIAEEASKLMREHPDWFVTDSLGSPLSSAECSFGGWRHAPWYMLDATHPEAQAFLTSVFRTMRESWGCRYFKLDALMWGALPFGNRYDRTATSVSAYRAGMEAIRKGCGEDSYLVGANAPMWPSMGELHGMRVSNDISRKWERFRETARELSMRRWQHEKLWLNDPDCTLLRNLANPIVGAGGEAGSRMLSGLTEDEFSFHRAVILSSGSAVLSGDRLTDLTESRISDLKKLLAHAGRQPVFTQDQICRLHCGSYELVCAFNPSDGAHTATVPSQGWSQAEDFWSKSPYLTENDGIILIYLPPHSARVLRLYNKT